MRLTCNLKRSWVYENNGSSDIVCVPFIFGCRSATHVSTVGYKNTLHSVISHWLLRYRCAHSGKNAFSMRMKSRFAIKNGIVILYHKVS